MATIEIDGKVLETENGKMIIEVADEAGIPIPRFCYHKKLSVAANCRMCLVEVEKSRKPVPACATPITDGMKVMTQSPLAQQSQQAVMEFLLINHPLDCPICDQGGECELQDVSMGYGQDTTDYVETKRSVESDDLGTLIETEMTRCIHCTRCVRFGDEIAGLRELGATGRGEHTQIGTYIKHCMTSEVSGNVIDLCPVGALTSKPYRYTSRAWELAQHEGVAPHDCLGTSLHLHTRRDKLMRVVPKENEAINETWISDRDRFSYTGLSHDARAKDPQIKIDGQWEKVDWQVALEFAANGIARVIKHHGPEQVAAFSSPSATLEEHYLLQKLMRELGVQNLDSRLHQSDFKDQAQMPVLGLNTLKYCQLENQNTIFMVGCNIQRELPVAALKIRKAYRNGAKIYSLNPVDYDVRFGVQDKIICSPTEMTHQLLGVLSALVKTASTLPEDLQRLVLGVKPTQTQKIIADALNASDAALVLGQIAINHPEASVLKMLAHWICRLTNANVIYFPTGANAFGASLAGMLPHRTTAGKHVATPGLNIQEALESKLKAYVLMGIDPVYDIANPALTRQSMLGAEFVVALSSFEDEFIKDCADVILPMAAWSETSGTYFNIDGEPKTVQGVASPIGQSRPAWKILRVLGNLLMRQGFEFSSNEEVLEEINSLKHGMSQKPYEPIYPQEMAIATQGMVRVGEWPLYRIDATVRHAKTLQRSAASEKAVIRMNPKSADKLNLSETATVSQGDIEITLPLIKDERIAADVVWVSNALPETIDLGHAFANITIKG